VQGTIAQIIALVTHGNACLKGSPGFDPSAFYPANSTFVFCEYVRFVDLRKKKRGWDESAYAADPNEWFARLKRDGVYSLRMSCGSASQQLGGKKVSDRMLVGFVGGGGRWLIEAMKPAGSDYWEGGWEVGDRVREDRRIWRVAYGRIASDQPVVDNPATDLPALRNQLAENLKAIGDFARRHKLDNFARAFDGGLAQLNSSDPSQGGYHSDLAPNKALPAPAVQLLGAAQSAWVFGGMGSWNDMGFDGDDGKLYDCLSEELYRLLNAAIVAAANSSAPMKAQSA
jgi:hypothetical protein